MKHARLSRVRRLRAVALSVVRVLDSLGIATTVGGSIASSRPGYAGQAIIDSGSSDAP
jgi:hypothetical protein